MVEEGSHVDTEIFPYLRSGEPPKHLPWYSRPKCIPKAGRDWLPAMDMKRGEKKVRRKVAPL